METISKKEFEAAKDMAPTLKEEAKIKMLDPKEMEELLTQMESPLTFQKELAVKVKIALDHQIAYEMKEKGFLSSHTRGWVETYNKILKELQSGLYGDKSVNLHLHKVTHGDISNKIRESVVQLDIDKKGA